MPESEKRLWHSHKHEVNPDVVYQIWVVLMASCAPHESQSCHDRKQLCISVQIELLTLRRINVPNQSRLLQVMSGSLVAPEIPEIAERQEMKSLIDTYGAALPLLHPVHIWVASARHLC